MNSLLMLFTILPPIFIFSIILLKYKSLDRLIISILLATLLHELLLVTFPILYSINTNFEHEFLLNISFQQNDLINVMIGETLYVFGFCFIFLIGLRIKKNWFFNKNTNIDNFIFSNITERRLFAFLVFIGTFLFFLDLVSMRVSISNPIINQLLQWSSGIFFSYTPIIASAILVTKKNIFKYNPKLASLAIVCLFSVVILGILTAARGRIMWVASLVIILGYINNQKKIIFTSVVVLIFFLPFFSFLGSYKNYAATSLISGGKSSDLVKIIFEERSTIKDISQNNSSFFYSFAERAQGPRNSIILYNLYDQNESPNAKIYLGSIFFPVPRFFWPTKPIPGSTNDDEKNSAVFKVMNIGHDLPYMGPILASAHAYWEGGYFAVLFYGVITGFFWILILIFILKMPYNLSIIICLSFAASLLIDGFLTIFSPIYAYILIFWKWVFPILFLYVFLKLFKTTKKYINL